MTTCQRCAVLPGQVVYTATCPHQLLCWPCMMERMAADFPTIAQPAKSNDLPDLLGFPVAEPCPDCGRPLLANRQGSAWCQATWCTFRGTLAQAQAVNERRREAAEACFRSVEPC